MSRIAIALVAAAVVACSSTPPPPDWQMNAKSSLERATAAYLSGNSRIEVVEFARVRADLARTGRPDLVARAELARCAARVASLEFDECPGYQAVERDAAAPERAYAAYLRGTLPAADGALLPEPQRAALTGNAAADSLARIADPLSRLVAAGVLLRSGKGDPAAFALATDTASAQGWSRPLMAWLNVRVQRADAAGEAEEAARLRRRIRLVLDGTGPPAAPRTAN